MLDIAFLRLIESTLAVLCAPESALAERENAPGDLIRHIDQNHETSPETLVGAIVADVWRHCEAVSLPRELTADYVDHLSDCVLAAEFEADLVSRFLGLNETAAEGDTAAIASFLAAVLLAAEDLDRDELDPKVREFVLTVFVRALHTQRESIAQWRSAIAAYFRVSPKSGPNEAVSSGPRDAAPMKAKLGPPPLPEAPPPLPKSAPQNTAPTANEEKRQVNIPEDLRAALRGMTSKKGPGTPSNENLEQAIGIISEVITKLDRLVAVPGFHTAFVANAKEHLLAGRISDSDRQLAAAEDVEVRNAQSNFETSRDLLDRACDIRIVRAELQRACTSHVKAARHFGFAQRYVGHHGDETRWQLARREANEYETAATRQKDFTRLRDAAKACSSALAALPQENSSDRAEAQLVLARLSLQLAEQEANSERCELVLRLLESVLAAHPANPDAIRSEAEKMQADAFAMLGWDRSDVAMIERAAFAYQSILQRMFEAPAPATGLQKVEIQARLALATQSAGVLHSNPELITSGLELLRHNVEKWPNPMPSSDLSGLTCLARVHHALARWYAGRSADGVGRPNPSDGANAGSTAGSHYQQAEAFFAAAGCLNLSLVVRDEHAAAGSGDERTTSAA